MANHPVTFFLNGEPRSDRNLAGVFHAPDLLATRIEHVADLMQQNHQLDRR
jgi:hypothetical protein